MLQLQPGKLMLQQFDGLCAVDHARVWGQLQTCVKTTHQIQAERVEGANPQSRGRFGLLSADAVGHLASGLVREGEQ